MQIKHFPEFLHNFAEITFLLYKNTFSSHQVHLKLNFLKKKENGQKI
jgi:hypothetical protein